MKSRLLSLAVSVAMVTMLDAKKVTEDFLKSEIASVNYTQISPRTTHCLITTHSGVEFTGESTVADESNYDEELGKQYAYQQAFNSMYEPYGFLLRYITQNQAKSEDGNQAEESQQLTFGDAVEQLKLGKTVARQGWNGKGMFLFVVKGETVAEAIEDCYGDPSKKGVHTALDAIYMHTVQGDLVPWLASQTDVLSEDWQVA